MAIASLAPAAPLPEQRQNIAGYNNTTTTISKYLLVALDLDSTTSGRGFILPNTTNGHALLGATIEDIPPGAPTYTDRLVRQGVVQLTVQGTTGGIGTGAALIPIWDGSGVVQFATSGQPTTYPMKIVHIDPLWTSTGKIVKNCYIDL